VRTPRISLSQIISAKRKFVFFSFGIGSGPPGPVLFYQPPPLIDTIQERMPKKRRREDEHLELQRVMLSALAAQDYTAMRNILMEASKKFEESNKEVVSFSCKELHDEHFGEKGLDLKMDLVGPPIIESFLLSSAEPTPQVSDWLSDTLTRIHQVWKLNNEKARRILIDAILTDVITSDQKLRAAGYCEVRLQVETEGFVFNGYSDYMLGSTGKSLSRNPEPDCFLLVVEAKNGMNDQAVLQALAQAACIQKHRNIAAKPRPTPVFAVLTNAFSFQFFAIDEDKQVYCSRLLPLTFASGGWKSNASLIEILRWFKWVLGVMKSISPRFHNEGRTVRHQGGDDQGSAAIATAGQEADHYAEFRSCFRLPEMT
jgi:hypothetical protein